MQVMFPARAAIVRGRVSVHEEGELMRGAEGMLAVTRFTIGRRKLR
ncbi:hypothetical protein ABIB82_005662 [Bradyrhizobium sp. i1.8.4]